MAPLFVLRTLGVPQLVTATGEVVRFRTRKHFALAIRLAVEPGRPLTRDHLFELLWSDAPEQRGRHSLAQAITVLKAKLGRSSLIIHKATVALTPGVVDADVLHLDTCDTEIAGRFLEGFELPHPRTFEDWRDAWHAGLLPRLRDCLVKQMDAGRRVGDFEKVERHANVLRELEPLSEDALRGVMEARAWVGDRTSALKAFAEFEARLESELGAKPHQDLVRIAHLLREGRRSPYRHLSESQSEVGEKRFEPEKLIGREQEFARLHDAWEAVRRRHACLVLVKGDAGVGKTTLANAFASTCQFEGALVARAQAYDAERELPFAVLAELVRQLITQRVIGSAEPEALSELSRLCPEVLTIFPGVQKPVDWSADVAPLRIADAFLKALAAAAEDRPLVVLVDDVHAADNASVAILHVVARKLDGMRLLLLMTGRNNELRSSPANAIATDVMIRRLSIEELATLPRDSAIRLVTSILRPELHQFDQSVVDRVLAAANGNPLALELLSQDCNAHGKRSLLFDLDRLNTLPADRLGIPRAIDVVFERQVTRLSSSIRSILNFAAVLGRRLASLKLYESVGFSATAAADGLAGLLAEGLLREVHGDLEFRNELIRARAYYAIPAPARQELHRLAAQALSGHGPSDGAVLLEVAWHFLRAGAVNEALTPGLHGAALALEAGAPREAERFLQVLLDFELEERSGVVARLFWCRALIDQSRAELAIPFLDAALERTDLLTPKQIAEAAALKATAEYLVQRETGRVYSSGALTALTLAKQCGDDSLIAKALFEVARSGAELGDPDRVIEAHNQLLTLLERSAGLARAMAHYATGYCLYFLYEIDAAANHLQSARDILGDSNPVLLGRVLTGLGNCMHSLCEVDAARHAFRTAFEIANKLGDDSRASVNASNLSALTLLEGDFETGISWGVEAVERGRRALNQPMLQNAYGNLTEAYLLSGRTEAAMKSRTHAASWFQRERSWLARVQYLAEEGCHELLMGHLSQAINISEEVERLIGHRARAVPPTCSYEMLKTIRLHEQNGYEEALRNARSVTDAYLNRIPLAFLTAAVVELWLVRNERSEEVARTRDLRRQIRGLIGKAPGRWVLYRGLGLVDRDCADPAKPTPSVDGPKRLERQALKWKGEPA